MSARDPRRLHAIGSAGSSFIAQDLGFVRERVAFPDPGTKGSHDAQQIKKNSHVSDAVYMYLT
jgi:hypothetical protein